MYVSSRDGTKRANIDSYMDINEKMLEDLDKIEAQVVFLTE